MCGVEVVDVGEELGCASGGNGDVGREEGEVGGNGVDVGGWRRRDGEGSVWVPYEGAVVDKAIKERVDEGSGDAVFGSATPGGLFVVEEGEFIV